MNVVIFYYDGFCEFEVVFCALQFRGHCQSVALENRVYISEENQRFLPDKTIEELNPDDIDLFIIPGGNPEYLYGNKKLENFLNELDKRNKLIAGICGGTSLIANFGLLKGKQCTGNSSGLSETDEDIDLYNDAMIIKSDFIKDGNIITATGQSYLEFSFELGKIMGIYKNEEEAFNRYKWFKNIK